MLKGLQMNSLLLKNRPEDASPEEFKKAWDNSGYVFEALWKTITEWMKENETIRKNDFDCPNHYARLAFQAGLNESLERVIGLLPPSAKPN